MGRAGSYQRQPGAYRAFLPATLPPDPAVAIDDEMQGLLSRADRALGRLDGSIQTLPDPDLFVFMYVRKEAVLSSQIEGTQSSLTDLLAVEAEMRDSSIPGDVDEVVNYVSAMNHGLDRLASLPVSVRLIREIHERLLRGVRGEASQPGQIRRTQNWIGPIGGTISDAVFVPPPSHEVPQALGELERYLHADDLTPVLIRLGLAHAQFETIHPFLDGNGRVGRLLITLLLCEKEILIKPVLYLSFYFKQFRSEYYDRLQAIRDEGAWEDWLKFFLRGVADVSNQATETARGIVDLREKHRRLIASEFGGRAGNAMIVLESLYRRPIISVNHAVRLTGLTYPAANVLISMMVRGGILREITGRVRNRRFRYDDYIGLFD